MPFQTVYKKLVHQLVATTQIDVAGTLLGEGVQRQVALAQEPQTRVAVRQKVMLVEAKNLKTRIVQHVGEERPKQFRSGFVDPIMIMVNLGFHSGGIIKCYRGRKKIARV